VDEVYNKLKTVSQENINLFLITRNKKGEKIVYGALTTEIEEGIRQDFINTVQNQLDIIKSKGIRKRNYTTAKTDDDFIETIEKDNIKYLDSILTTMVRADLESYTPKYDNKLWAYAIDMGDIILFQKISAQKILTPSKKILLTFGGEGKFSKFEQSLFAMNFDIDCVYCDETMYIINKVPFENIFSFVEQFKKEIDVKIANLATKDVIVKLDSISDKCKTDPRKIKRLHAALNNGVINVLNVDIANKINSDYNLNLNFNADGKIEVNDDNIWDVLRVINDDYLKSIVTNNKYEIHGKLKK
jgi:hypothetical protein